MQPFSLSKNLVLFMGIKLNLHIYICVCVCVCVCVCIHILYFSFLKVSVLQRYQLSLHWIIFVSFKHNLFSLICFNHLFTFISFCLFLSNLPCPFFFNFSNFYCSLACFQCGLYFCDYFFLFTFFWGLLTHVYIVLAFSIFLEVLDFCFELLFWYR